MNAREDLRDLACSLNGRRSRLFLEALEPSTDTHTHKHSDTRKGSTFIQAFAACFTLGEASGGRSVAPAETMGFSSCGYFRHNCTNRYRNRHWYAFSYSKGHKHR